MGDMTKRFVAHQATVPFTFRFQVSHRTQRSLYNPSQLSRVYDKAPRGAAVSLSGSPSGGPPFRTGKVTTLRRCRGAPEPGTLAGYGWEAGGGSRWQARGR